MYCAGRLPDDPALALPESVPRALGSGHERGAWWAERHLARAARSEKDDVLFCPAYTCPLTAALPRVTAVHDLSFFAWPDDFGSLDGIRRRVLVGASLRASHAVLACSDFTRREIARFFPDVAPRVVHVPQAGAEDLPPSPPRDEARARLGARTGDPYRRHHPEPPPAPVLLRAAAHVRRAWPGLVLEVVGDNRRTPARDRRPRARAGAGRRGARVRPRQRCRAGRALRGRRRRRIPLRVRGFRTAGAGSDGARRPRGGEPAPLAERDLRRRRAARRARRRGRGGRGHRPDPPTTACAPIWCGEGMRWPRRTWADTAERTRRVLAAAARTR